MVILSGEEREGRASGSADLPPPHGLTSPAGQPWFSRTWLPLLEQGSTCCCPPARTRGQVTRARGDGTALEQAITSPPPLPHSSSPSWAAGPSFFPLPRSPPKLGAVTSGHPLLLALLLFWGGTRGGERWKTSPAQKRRRASPARPSPCSMLHGRGWSEAHWEAGLVAWRGTERGEGDCPVSPDPKGGTWRGPGPPGCPRHSGSVLAPSRTSSAAATRRSS